MYTEQSSVIREWRAGKRLIKRTKKACRINFDLFSSYCFVLFFCVSLFVFSILTGNGRKISYFVFFNYITVTRLHTPPFDRPVDNTHVNNLHIRTGNTQNGEAMVLNMP